MAALRYRRGELRRHQRRDRQTYTLVAADIGKTLRVVVTATNDVGSTTATSARPGRSTVRRRTIGSDRRSRAPPSGADADGTARAPGTATRRATPIGGTAARPPAAASPARPADLRRSGGRRRLHDQLEVTRRTRPARARLLADTAVVRAIPVNTALPVISGSRSSDRQLTRPQRHLERQPDQLHLPVAALRRAGASCTDIGLATSATYAAAGGGRRQDDPGHRDGDERRRLRPGDLRPDRGRQRRAGEHRRRRSRVTRSSARR